MNTLPYYFNYFPTVFPEPVIEMFVSIENSFYTINYDAHRDDISAVYDILNLNTTNLNNLTLEIYREHITSVMSLQGIFLANPFTEKFSNLVQLVNCVSVLATNKVSELLEGEVIELEDNNEYYFAKLIEALTELTYTDALLMIDYVSKGLIDYLNKDLPTAILTTETRLIGETRFKNSILVKEGVIVEAIRKLNYFGYDINTFLVTHTLDISDIKDDNEMAKEIILLVLGSSTPDELLTSTMFEVANHIGESVQQILSLNNKILHYMSKPND
jgi:hypothetical protein